MIDLNDAKAIARADPGDALGAAERAAEQWAEGARRARAAALPDSAGITGVLFCGMGGSGIAGDVLAALAASRSSVPVSVVKGYEVPSWVGASTLVICASYSGNTEEMLSCFEQASAKTERVLALTTGGRLAELADARGFARISPVEGLQPRAALPSLTAPVLVVMHRLGLLPGIETEIAEAEDALAARAKEFGRDAPDNDAKRLAERLDGFLPLIWGQDGILSVAAIRWRCQLNENAKVPAFSSLLPELDHNEIVGYDPGVKALKQVALVVLRAPEEHPRVAKRIAATLAVMGERVGRIEEAWSTGASSLARLVSASVFGDFTSIYLALRRGVDPTPVTVIEALKKTLAR